MSPRTEGAEHFRSIRLDSTLYPPVAVAAASKDHANRCEFVLGDDGIVVVRALPGASADAVDEFLNCALRLAVEAYLGNMRAIGAHAVPHAIS